MSRPIKTVLNKLLPPTQIVFKVAVHGTDCEKASHHNKDLTITVNGNWRKPSGNQEGCSYKPDLVLER